MVPMPSSRRLRTERVERNSSGQTGTREASSWLFENRDIELDTAGRPLRRHHPGTKDLTFSPELPFDCRSRTGSVEKCHRERPTLV